MVCGFVPGLLLLTGWSIDWLAGCGMDGCVRAVAHKKVRSN